MALGSKVTTYLESHLAVVDAERKLIELRKTAEESRTKEADALAAYAIEMGRDKPHVPRAVEAYVAASDRYHSALFAYVMALDECDELRRKRNDARKELYPHEG